MGGAIRDVLGDLAARGYLGPALTGPAAGYCVVYHIEIGLLFASLVAIGPLVRRFKDPGGSPSRFGLAELPG
jgi:BCD family chlorophyll transporter-like MFS transporter